VLTRDQEHLPDIGAVVSGNTKVRYWKKINKSMKTYYVYLLTDPRNNDQIFYCGKGSGDRWKSHIGHWSANGKNNPTENKIKNIQKQGLQPGVIFLHTNIIDENEAYRLEENYIRENFDSLTNLKIEAKPPSAKGRVSWNKGLNLSTQHKEKISKGLLGNKRGPYTSEHRLAISESLVGNKHPMYGKPAKNRKPIKEITTNQIFSNQLEAADRLNIKQSDIANCLGKRQKSTKGFMFEYVA
jgi:hypothetical protein